MRRTEVAGGRTFKIEIGRQTGSYLVDVYGARREVTALPAEGKLTRYEATPIEPQHRAFRTAQVAFGRVRDPFGKMIIGLVEREGKPQASIMTYRLEGEDANGVIELRAAGDAKSDQKTS